jgi:exodeoxyribonuclease V alpha subunit
MQAAPNQLDNALKQETMTGVVERLTYHSSESGYTVARFKCVGAKQLITIVGNFANIQPGQTLEIKGSWREHLKYGAQFEITFYEETKPATLTGIEKYLGSGLIKGVGPVTAKRIVAHFGLDTLDIIDNHIGRLSEVPGIAKKRIEMIQEIWESQKAIKEVMVFLQSHNVSTTYSVKIYKQYGAASIGVVTTNPYQLSTDIYGIGFITADKIAHGLGVPSNSEFRYKAGLTYCLSQAAEDGHCYLPQYELVQKTVQLLRTEDHTPKTDSIEFIIHVMSSEGDIIREIDTDTKNWICYKPIFFHTEQNLAVLLNRRLLFLSNQDIPRVRTWIEKFSLSRKMQLSSQQQEAVEIAAYSKISIITGGPGTGKTFSVRTVVELWKAMGKKIALAAPTGRAAQRLMEMTGLEAKTIHRLLEFDPKSMDFKRDDKNPLSCNALIVDEASMLDLFLAYSLIKAVPEGAQILFVGDIDQLPSVGAGQVLADLINSGKIPVIRLTQVFRQASASAIIRSAHQINNGEFPALDPIDFDADTITSDCLWHTGGYNPEQGVQIIANLVTNFIPSLGFNPVTDVQLLCPMLRGIVGTYNLNNVLQQIINPPGADKTEITWGNIIYREGDKVIQLTNDYHREIFNGDVGFISCIDTENQEVVIQFSEREVVYDYSDLNEINLAFAVSVHKAQGSEYPVVILPLYTQHYMMLSRNLFYTGLTRAKRLAVVVGAEKAINLAINSNRHMERYTKLKHRLALNNILSST